MEQEIASQVVGLGGSTDFSLLSLFLRADFVVKSVILILIAASMVLNMIVAGLFGILIPVSLKKFNIDPALASSVFVTTITDVIGFLSFLGLGAYLFYG